jgi:hypothetical protein
MRQAALVLGAVLLYAGGAAAQARPDTSSQQMSVSLPAPASSNALFAWAAPANSAAGFALPSAEASSAAADPQVIYGVLPDFNWQVYAGYAYERFYEVPGTTINMNGFDVAVTYYPRIRWIGAEGDVSAGFGSLSGVSSQFATEMGGLRLRWQTPRGMDLWIHGLVGGAYLAPKTIYGGQNALGDEVGAGIDLPRRNSRLSYRVEGDIVGTRFFGTYQYSAKVTVGLVYKF